MSSDLWAWYEGQFESETTGGGPDAFVLLWLALALAFVVGGVITYVAVRSS